MRNFLLFSCLCLIAFQGCSKDDPQTEKMQNLIDVDFDRSLGFRGFHKKNIDVVFASPFERIKILKKIYEERRPSQVKAAAVSKIPKIIHQIWLHARPPSKAQIEWMKSVRKMHPSWEYRFWTMQEAQDLDFDLKELFIKSKSLREKEDILRAEVLDRFGGLFIDSNFEVLKPFDQLHYKYDFYSGILFDEDAATMSKYHLSSALVAACPNHPLIKEWKEIMRKSGSPNKKNIEIQCESPSFVQTVLNQVSEDKNVVILPPTYFYPLRSSELLNWQRLKANTIKRLTYSILRFCNIIKSRPFSEIRPETLTIYHWGGHALKTSEERILDLYHKQLQIEKELILELQELRDEIQNLKKEK